MLVRIGDTAAIVRDLAVLEVRWQAAASDQEGGARLWIPRSDPAYDPQYLNPRGGSWVELHAGPHGVFHGIADVPKAERGGAIVPVLPLSRWLAIRRVPGPRRTLIGLTAGAIARQAARLALGPLGQAAIPLGTFVEGGPALAEFQLGEQTLLDVLRSLHQATGQEWSIDARSGRLSWMARQGRPRYERVLLDLGQVGAAPASGSLADVVREVTEVLPDGTSYTATAPDVSPRWPAQRVERI